MQCVLVLLFPKCLIILLMTSRRHLISHGGLTFKGHHHHSIICFGLYGVFSRKLSSGMLTGSCGQLMGVSLGSIDW